MRFKIPLITANGDGGQGPRSSRRRQCQRQA